MVCFPQITQIYAEKSFYLISAQISGICGKTHVVSKFVNNKG